MNKLIEYISILFFAFLVGLSYHLGAERAKNECRLDVELRNVQIESMLKKKYRR